MVSIRLFQTTDRSGLEACMIVLQDYEKALGADRKPGAEIAKEYIDYLLGEVAAKHGVMYVAEQNGQIVGFVSAWVDEDDVLIAKGETRYVYCSDGVVLDAFRRQGVGRKLLAAVEAFAKAAGIVTIKCTVLADNTVMRQGISAAGFHEYEIVYQKVVGKQ